MVTAHITTRLILSSFLPRFSQPAISNASRFTTLYSRQLSTPLLPSLSLAIPTAISLNIPGLIEGLWESILRAVPKKKTSHSKSRSRRLAGKGLKDVTNLVKCPGCGSVKRAHVLCPYCVAEIQAYCKGKSNATLKKEDVEAKKGNKDGWIDTVTQPKPRS